LFARRENAGDNTNIRTRDGIEAGRIQEAELGNENVDHIDTPANPEDGGESLGLFTKSQGFITSLKET